MIRQYAIVGFETLCRYARRHPFIRRLKRDMSERGRTVDSVIKQYLEVVRPGHFNFIEPTKEYADLVIPEGGYNENALHVLITFVKELSKGV